MSQDLLQTQVQELAQAAKRASRVIGVADTAKKNAVLKRAAEAITGDLARGILEGNAKDMAAAEKVGLSGALLDRLKLDAKGLDGIGKALLHVATLPDPVGEIAEMRRLENGLQVGRMRVPLGVIAIIYESRPNVTADAAALCIKSGNACILRGGKEAFHSNQALALAFEQALRAEGLPTSVVSVMPTIDRQATLAMLALDEWIDLVIPRGGEALIRFVAEHSRIPVIKHYKGVCHVYVDADADFDMAEGIVINSKAQRPGVCNALETLLVDRACANEFVPRMVARLQNAQVEVRGDAEVVKLAQGVIAATEADWDTEYLDRILSIAVVPGMEGALTHIAQHGTYHTEAIVTRSYSKAQRWLREVDASLVLVNASTRFNDGGELGLGAEIGISTTKLHAYGPMGLNELNTWKWIAYGHGQIRS